MRSERPDKKAYFCYGNFRRQSAKKKGDFEEKSRKWLTGE